MDAFPEDQARLTRQIQRDIVQAQASAGTNRPLTEASQGWILRSASGPNPSTLGPNDVWIGAQGGRLVAMDDSGGTIALAPVSFPIAAYQVVDAYILSNAGSSYDQSLMQNVVDAIEVLSAQVAMLRDKLISGDLMLPG